jgi:hypothetical protein
MVKICRTGLLKLNFEIVPKKRIFRFLPKISAGHRWSWKFFFAYFQTLGPLGCQGWLVIPQNVKKSQNHCTLMGRLHRLAESIPGLLQCLQIWTMDPVFMRDPQPGFYPFNTHEECRSFRSLQLSSWNVQHFKPYSIS